ncbi:MAG: NAD(P)-dependent glycerol-1-phosphate dehydrogenase [Nitrososphaerales archaeon]
MDLPKSVLVGNGVVRELGSFLKNLGCRGVVHIVSGPHVMAKVKTIVEEALKANGFTFKWSKIDAADMKTVQLISRLVSRKVDIMLGLGGGKTVDVAKLVAYNAGLSFISVPTSASHDGISSPFASIKGSDSPYSFVAYSPLGIIADLDIIGSAPFHLLASGCGDLIGKVTAVKDWEIARDDKGEYFGKYAASLAHLSADIVMKEAKNIGLRKKESFRDVVEALISAGVAAGIAGSSRPCSGSEHLFAHALDIIGHNNGLHGEKVGLGTILMAKLHEIEWEKIVKALEDIQAPTRGRDLDLDDESIVKAILYAKKIRPDRYTILDRTDMDERKALSLARSTNVI